MFITISTSPPLSLLLLFLSSLLLAAALPSPSPMTEEEFELQGVWGPTSVFFWRCRSPLVVETSWDLDHWIPSSVCLEGTCCSPLAEGPLCTKAACGMGVGAQIPPRPKGQDPVAVSGGNVPKLPRRRGEGEEDNEEEGSKGEGEA